MNIPLSKVRRENHLQLCDVACLLDIDRGNLSKYESGKMVAPTQVQLGYHLLFGLEYKQNSIFDHHQLSLGILDRAKELEKQLLTQRLTRKRLCRLRSMQSIISRLSQQLSL